MPRKTSLDIYCCLTLQRTIFHSKQCSFSLEVTVTAAVVHEKIITFVCVCVCVCKREERERERVGRVGSVD